MLGVDSPSPWDGSGGIRTCISEMVLSAYFNQLFALLEKSYRLGKGTEKDLAQVRIGSITARYPKYLWWWTIQIQ